MLAVLGIMIITILAGSSQAAGQVSSGRKMVVLLIDGLTVDDLQNPELPAFSRLAGIGAVGLLNTRTESMLTADRTNACLTIGMGVRTHVPEMPDSAANGLGKDGLFAVVNRAAGQLERIVREEYPNHTPGKIGESARQYGLTLAVVGNADTSRPHREAALIAMDSSGKVPVGSIGREVLREDPGFPWGIRTDPERLFTVAGAALARADVLFVDFGDTFRLEEAKARLHLPAEQMEKLRGDALRRADRLLQRLLNQATRNNWILMVVSPMASVAEIARGNRTLTPVIIYDRNFPPGLLSSGTTRTLGIVANIDIGPTIFARLGFNPGPMKFLGEPVRVFPAADVMTTVSGNLAKYIGLKKARYMAHAFWVSLIVAALVVMYWPLFSAGRTAHKRLENAVAAMVLAFPATAFLVPVVLGISPYYLTMAAVFLLTVVWGLVFSANYRRTLAGMAVSGIITSAFITVDLLLGRGLLANTPLGFDDVFLGGRYYGINNDCMGILIGSTAFALFYLLDKTRAGRFPAVSVTAFVFALVVISQTPPFGANVGGTIAAATTGTMAVLALVSRQPLRKKPILLTVAAVFVAEILIAYWDYRFGSRTHAGKVMASFLSQGFGPKFREVLESKLSLFGLMLVLPPWNLVLGAEAVIFHQARKRLRSPMASLGQVYPVLTVVFEVLFYGGLVAFAFNDTGVIATALMFAYLVMPLGVLLINRDNMHINNR